MRAPLAAFSAGIVSGSLLLEPLTAALLAGLGAGLCLPAWQAVNNSIGRIGLGMAAAFLTGLAWHGLWAAQALDERLPADFARQTLLIEGRVVSIPSRDALATRFRLHVSEEPLAGKTLILRDYSERKIRGGEHWRLPVRLRPPRGLANPGGFDYEAWLLAEGVDGLGYVRDEAGAERLAQASFSATSLRQYLLTRLQQLVADNELGAEVLPALLLGHRAGLSDSFNRQLETTGTNHLFVISGIHIGLVSLLVYSLACVVLRWFWPINPDRPGRPVQTLAAWAAILAAILYSLLAGFSLPTQRALVMITVLMMGRFLGRRFNLLFRFLLALGLVLILNPLAAMSAGFWLSFSAVAGLFVFVDNHNASRLCSVLKSQAVVYLILLLPLLFWMGQVSLIAPLVNIIAIPMLGFALLPLAFAGLVAGLVWFEAGRLLLSLASQLLEFMMAGLAWAGQLLPMWSPGLAGLQGWELLAVLVPAGMSLTLLLLPLTWSLRCLALPLLLPLLLGPARVEPDDRLQVHVLDVGQGLAVVASQAGKTMLYDTGARLDGGSDMAASVVLPFLKSRAVARLDLLVISHGDNDHAGGLPTLLASLPVTRLLGSDPSLSDYEGDRCRSGQQLHLGDVEIEVLHPARGYKENNNNSCVLQLRYGSHRVLLSGDITRTVEYELVRQQGAALASQLLLVPHHGSATSSSFPFVKTVNPQWAVYSAGCHNRFSHPADEVDRRYTLLGASTLNTAGSGLISFTLDGSGGEFEPLRYRQVRPRYWRSQNGADCR